MPTWAMWLACLSILWVRGLLAATEAALHGTSELRAKELLTAHPRRGARVLRLKTEREGTAAALRFGMVLSGFLAAAIGTLVPPRLLDFSRLGDEPYLALVTPLASALFVAFLASIIDLTFRSLANTNPEGWALRLSGLASFVRIVGHPPMRVVMVLLNVVLRPFGTTLRFEAPPPPLDELESMLAAKAAKEEMDEAAPQLIRSIFEMTDKTVRDVMVPRTDVVSVSLDTPVDEILRVLAEENHSRMPVYQGDVDRIVGTLHVRDLIPMLQHPELIVLPDVIRPTHYVPWMKSIGDLLREMQQKRIHMSVVVDEYGSFMGIVTLEDILREIVGDMPDEFEVEAKQVEKQADGSFLADAGMSVEEFKTAFGFPLPEGEFETLGGFVSHLAGAIPDLGERFAFNGWQFIVHAKQGPRLARVRLLRPKPPGAAREKLERREERSPEPTSPPMPSPVRGG